MGLQEAAGLWCLTIARSEELGDRPDTHGHHVAKDKAESCTLAVKAGVNIEFPEPDCYLHLVELVRKSGFGGIRTWIRHQWRSMLLQEFKMGLFENHRCGSYHEA